MVLRGSMNSGMVSLDVRKGARFKARMKRERTTKNAFFAVTPILFTQIDESGYVIFSIVLRADRITITRFPFQRSNVGPRVSLLRCSKHASRENESIITYTQTRNKANMFYRVYIVSRIDRCSNQFLFR